LGAANDGLYADLILLCSTAHRGFMQPAKQPDRPIEGFAQTASFNQLFTTEAIPTGEDLPNLKIVTIPRARQVGRAPTEIENLGSELLADAKAHYGMLEIIHTSHAATAGSCRREIARAVHYARGHGWPLPNDPAFQQSNAFANAIVDSCQLP